MKALFWLSLLAIAYPYFIYPVLLMAINRMFRLPIHAADTKYLPTVTILMPVHNEGGPRRQKVANLARLDYPPRRSRVTIADGLQTNC